ncbi:hypothetical protein [Pedobacter montanisoli]|uniref:AlgX/AlgJ SGNH hydrolase-like domain-containing protein n=1 Tax=Pedobacter montanisoli TaxID=2923277 RepID=A0ABS9ZXE0_9SPHI|nr:hypothetical protein [Pedobacter montanisoli]MCJ0742958.1 hypothetical protein [Pedobacter montanisoli]
MNNLVKIIAAIVILGALGFFFYTKSKDKESVVSSIGAISNLNGEASDSTTEKGLDPNNYVNIPREQLYDGSQASNEILAELKERYKTDFEKLVKGIKSTGAKVVFCWITAEPDVSMNKIGKPFIQNLCAQNGVDFVDFVPSIANKKDITFAPVDGHFNQNGAKILADQMAQMIRKYDNVKATATYDNRPELLGDFKPSQNTILDGGKNLPYKLVTNKQGLRMDHDLTFPKQKQRILLIGDSMFEFPFLDNAKTGSGLLQTLFPNKEVLNSAKLGYSIDDYLSLWEDRAKYTEPDIIFLQSSGDDISDLFFSHRLRYSRTAEKIKPSAKEAEYYKTLN